MNLAAVDTHPHVTHHPLGSSIYLDNVGCDKNDTDGDNSHISDMFPAQEAGNCLDYYDITVDQFLNEYKNAQGQQSTAVSKLKSSSII